MSSWRTSYSGRKVSQFAIIEFDQCFDKAIFEGKCISARISLPHWTVINPKNGHYHTIWLLDAEYELHIVKGIAEALRDLLGADAAQPPKFRSPFFRKGNRKGTEDRKGYPEADYHYVSVNDVDPYNPFDMYKRISANIIVKDTTSKSSDKTDNADDSLGRNVRLFNKARKEVYKRGLISLDAVTEITHSLNAEGLRVQEVNEVAKSVYRFISGHFLEHERNDPERARFQIEYRWLQHERIQGELLVGAAKRFGVSKSTILRWKKDYKIQLINKKWVKVDIKEFLF